MLTDCFKAKYFQFMVVVSLLVSADWTLAEDAVFKGLSGPWPASLARLSKNYLPNKSYLALVIRLSEANLDFRSPEHFKHGFLATPLAKASLISHAGVGWHCGVGDKLISGMAAQSGENNEQTVRMIVGGWGLTALFANFTDGYLQPPAIFGDITIGQNLNWASPRLMALVEEVDERRCQKVVSFVRQYAQVSPATGRYPGQNFGLRFKPENLEGGGCGSFAVAALNQADFFGEAEPYLWRELHFSMKLMGRPGPMEISDVELPPWVEKIPLGREIPFSRLQMSSWESDPQGPSLRVADPELIALFLRTVYAEYLRPSLRGLNPAPSSWYSQWLVRKLVSRFYFEVDPKQPSLKTEFVDENFDETSQLLVSATRRWFKQKLQDGAVLQNPSWGTQLALFVVRGESR